MNALLYICITVLVKGMFSNGKSFHFVQISFSNWKTKVESWEGTKFVSTFQLGGYFNLKTTPFFFQFAEQAPRQRTRYENVTYNLEFSQMPFTSMSLSKNGKKVGVFWSYQHS